MTAKNDDIVELYYENFYVEIVDYDDCVHLDNGVYVYGPGENEYKVTKAEILLYEDEDGIYN